MKIDFIPDSLHNLRNQFVENGFDMHLVGGVVRDTLAGLKPKDIDICTNANPTQQIELYEKANIRYILTGLQHGTISIILNNEIFEITSLRIDVETDGRHAKVEFTDNWEFDLARRDLTINAMSMDFDGNLFDPFGGKDDLENGIIKFVGNPINRIQEDYLRILRWFRFMGRFGNINNIDKHTKQCITDNANGLHKISGERIWAEMKKIIVQENGNNILELMDNMGVSQQIGSTSVYYTTDRNALFNIVKEITNSPELLIATWLYWNKNDIISIAERWKWSTAEKVHVFWLVDSIGKKLDLRKLIAVENIDRQWVRELVYIEQRDNWEKNALVEWEFTPFPVNGTDLINIGIKPGIKMGIIIKHLKEDWANSGYSATKEELLANKYITYFK
jgi:tRNA nucleotidyltransferase (CCA-adding enzyme)